MNPRELRQQQTAIEAAIRFGESLDEGLPERAIIARHVCVLTSGYLENAVRVRLSEFARMSRPKRELQTYVEETVDRFQNPEFYRILEITGRFDDKWRTELDAIDESIKEAIASI